MKTWMADSPPLVFEVPLFTVACCPGVRLVLKFIRLKTPSVFRLDTGWRILGRWWWIGRRHRLWSWCRWRGGDHRRLIFRYFKRGASTGGGSGSSSGSSSGGWASPGGSAGIISSGAAEPAFPSVCHSHLRHRRQQGSWPEQAVRQYPFSQVTGSGQAGSTTCKTCSCPPFCPALCTFRKVPALTKNQSQCNRAMDPMIPDLEWRRFHGFKCIHRTLTDSQYHKTGPGQLKSRHYR